MAGIPAGDACRFFLACGQNASRLRFIFFMNDEQRGAGCIFLAKGKGGGHWEGSAEQII